MDNAEVGMADQHRESFAVVLLGFFHFRILLRRENTAMKDRIEQEHETHARRLETLARRLEKLKRDIIDTEIQLENEQLIGEELAFKRRHTGLLALLDDGEDEDAVVSTRDEGEANELLDDVAEVEVTELIPA
jgi:hypothetical protein